MRCNYCRSSVCRGRRRCLRMAPSCSSNAPHPRPRRCLQSRTDYQSSPEKAAAATVAAAAASAITQTPSNVVCTCTHPTRVHSHAPTRLHLLTAHMHTNVLTCLWYKEQVGPIRRDITKLVRIDVIHRPLATPFDKFSGS